MDFFSSRTNASLIGESIEDLLVGIGHAQNIGKILEDLLKEATKVDVNVEELLLTNPDPETEDCLFRIRGNAIKVMDLADTLKSKLQDLHILPIETDI